MALVSLHRKIFFSLFVIFAICLATAVCYAADSEPAIKVGSEVEFPPFAVIDEKGQADGFSVELIKAVAKAMDLPIVITTGTWDTMWNSLVSGQLDVLPIVAKSPERQKLVDFSLSHTETFDVFFVRSGSPEIRDINAAHGKNIVVMRSDAAHHALLEHKFQGKIVLVDTIPEGLKLVASGKNDAFLCSKLIGILAIKKHAIKGLTAGPLVPDYKRVFSFGVRKGADELREKLNQGLLIVKASGEYDRIYEKWLSFDDPWRKYKKYLLITIVVLGAIAIIAIFWSVMLRIMVKRRTDKLKTITASRDELNREITERKIVEKKLNKAMAELERSNKELEQFAYIASHDLQEPLRTISSYIQLLAKHYKGKFDKDADDFIDFTVDGADRMQKMINDLLAYSRITTKAAPFEPVDCNNLFDDVLAGLRFVIEESGAVVTHDPLPVIKADASQIAQVFQNLIANAVKFRGQEAPKIHISAKPVSELLLSDSGFGIIDDKGEVKYKPEIFKLKSEINNGWFFSVRDNGIGFEPQYAEKIFEIFKRLTPMGKYPGSGIGLAICRKIVERHGGRIWAESEPGKGAVFYFVIPE